MGDERASLDRALKVNTSPRRQLSPCRQGSYWHRALPNMYEEDAQLLLGNFDEVLQEHRVAVPPVAVKLSGSGYCLPPCTH